MSSDLGQDWRNKSHRELVIQWQKNRMEAWSHTSKIMWAIVASLGGNKKIGPLDFNPYIDQSAVHHQEKAPVKPSLLKIKTGR